MLKCRVMQKCEEVLLSAAGLLCTALVSCSYKQEGLRGAIFALAHACGDLRRQTCGMQASVSPNPVVKSPGGMSLHLRQQSLVSCDRKSLFQDWVLGMLMRAPFSFYFPDPCVQQWEKQPHRLWGEV
jgi:hypothetical protein